MPEGLKGSINDHTGTGPPHDLTDALSHIRSVTMHTTIAADRFAFTETTMRKAEQGIVAETLVLLGKNVCT